MGILDGLNPRQLEAVQHVEGPLLVLAGAGSGKTRVLTRRIAYLIAHAKVAPWNILAVTFTNKAAAEMRERVEDQLGRRSEGMWVTTFHSACVRILRTDGERVGIRRNFVIYDTPDQQAVIKECLKELNLDPKNFDPRAVLDSIGKAKNELTSVDDYEAVAGDYWEKTVAKAYRLYQAKLRANNAVDFDDLIMETVNLFRRHEQVLDAYQERFRYILIDEYQDTNHAQYQLVRLLAAKYRNICVVGDEDQSIYGWRGADIRNILDFTDDYPECTVIKLEQNYRSTQRILDAANRVIENNRDRLEKNLWTEGPQGEKISFYRAFDERDEASYITGEIRRLAKAEKRPFADFALLYRTNAQSRVFEEAFMNLGLPYKVVGTLRFYERREIKDLLAYLRVIYDPDDSVSLRRIINVPRRGIGTATMTRLEEFAQAQGVSLFTALQRADEIEGVNSRFAGVLAGLAVLLQSFMAMALELPVTELVEKVLRNTGYQKELEDEHTPEADARLENLREFLSVAQEFANKSEDKSLGAFLEQVALVADVDTYDDEADAVTLMTLHSAKGLEFPVVFLAGMEEGLFPHSRAAWESDELEEERRLCYVGITRARERLYLTCADQRMMYGQTDRRLPSRFLEEIPEELLIDIREENDARQEQARREEQASKERLRQENAQRKSVTFAAGDRIRHGKWGTGTVVSVQGEGENTTLTVAFPNEGIKRLLAGFAPLERL